MEFLNRTVSQASDLLKSMTPAARLTAGMLFALIVISLIYLMAFRGGTADRYLFGGRELSDTEIDAVQSAFAAAKLDQYVPDGRRIRVPGNRLNEYMQALSKAGFTPSDVEAPINRVIAEAGDFMKSKEDKEFHRSQAQQQKLSRTISMRPEVDWATVQYREVKMGGFPPVTERKATVVACGAHHRPIDRAHLRTIRSMASSWFGIPLEDVAVTDVNGGIMDDLSSADGMSKEARMYAEAKTHYEDSWKQKIHECLSFIPGVLAAVNVEMNPVLSNESTKIDLDPQTIPVKSEIFSRTSENRPAAGGRPGAVPNEVPGNQPRNLGMLTNQETAADENREQQVSLAGHEQIRERRPPLVPKSVTATVSIPRSYYGRVWQERNPVVAGEEPGKATAADLKDIEQEVIAQVEEIVVKTLPPLASGEDSLAQVKASSYDDLTIPPLEPPKLSATVVGWLARHWQKLGLFALSLVSLFVLRGMMRSAAPPVETAALAIEQPTTDDDEQEEVESMPALHRRVTSSGSSLRDELTAMVREDPDAAANVLRTWIGDAA